MIVLRGLGDVDGGDVGVEPGVAPPPDPDPTPVQPRVIGTDAGDDGGGGGILSTIVGDVTSVIGFDPFVTPSQVVQSLPDLVSLLGPQSPSTILSNLFGGGGSPSSPKVTPRGYPGAGVAPSSSPLKPIVVAGAIGAALIGGALLLRRRRKGKRR